MAQKGLDFGAHTLILAMRSDLTLLYITKRLNYDLNKRPMFQKIKILATNTQEN